MPLIGGLLLVKAMALTLGYMLHLTNTSRVARESWSAMCLNVELIDFILQSQPS